MRIDALLAAIALSWGCATPAHVDFDSAVDFSGYRTFAIAPPAEAEEGIPRPTLDPAKSQLIDRRVQAALERGLAAKGLEAVEVARAELLVAFTMGSRRATRVDSYPDTFAHWPYGWWHGYWDHVTVRTYTEGMLVVDLIDAQRRQLVWRAWTTDPISESEDVAGTVEHAVETVLAEYPPPPR